MSVRVQAVWHDASLFTEAEAATWCEENGFISSTHRVRQIDGTVTHHIHAQFDTADAVEGSWRVLSDDYPDGIAVSVCEVKMTEIKAFSTFKIKSVNDDQRKLVGIASTPSPDRDGDEVMPGGAKFTLPFPLLHQHDHERPIGHVTKATVSDAGIEIEADIPKDSGLDYVETAWRQIKSGLLRGLSIGFRATKSEPTPTGRKFLNYEIFELSAVSIPANAEAGILAVKKYDADPINDGEQLFNAESKRADVLDRAAVAISNAVKTLETKPKRRRH